MTIETSVQTKSRGLTAITLAASMALVGCTQNTDVQPQDVATVFPLEISCSAAAQADFVDAVVLLHSFEYVQTSKLFAAQIEQEPACAMAYWGAAMSIWHPLWAPLNQAQLARGADFLAQTDGLEMSAKEAALINALKAFFSSTDLATNKTRARAYSAAMEQINADDPGDYEVEIFYALSLLGAADPRDKTYVNQRKAGTILKKMKVVYPRHPGVLHYIIHSYDAPGQADQALDEAKIYAGSAKDSSHAQHMPSHIFTRLGLWDLSISSNHDAGRSAVEYTSRANLPGHYDEGLHSIDYLMYALLQTARDDEAHDVLLQLGEIDKTDTENFKVAFAYASAPARYVLERRAWDEASELTLMRPDFHWQDFGWAQAINHFARGIGAARSGKIEQAKDEAALIDALQQGLPPTLMPYIAMEVQVQSDLVKAWIMLAEGAPDAALELARSAAELEDSMDKHPVTPGEILPARELYADMLFETGNDALALAQYQIVLEGYPNRLNALLGAARSAGRLGEKDAAQGYEAIIASQTASRTGNRAGLDPGTRP